jgi:hypothetical protein
MIDFSAYCHALLQHSFLFAFNPLRSSCSFLKWQKKKDNYCMVWSLLYHLLLSFITYYISFPITHLFTSFTFSTFLISDFNEKRRHLASDLKVTIYCPTVKNMNLYSRLLYYK